MKIHKNNATHRGVSKRSTYFLLYTAAFLICSACIYVWFARTGRSLISTGDGWKQHFPAFVYFGQYGRTVLRTLLTEHQLVLPQWNFSLGYGGDILTTLHYYVIGDPLDLLSIACPTRYAVYLYSFLSLFRLYLAGLGFGAFCRYKKQGAPLPVAVGSVCYVFFTYSFLLVARHPFFAIPMVYLPLLFRRRAGACQAAAVSAHRHRLFGGCQQFLLFLYAGDHHGHLYRLSSVLPV